VAIPRYRGATHPGADAMTGRNAIMIDLRHRTRSSLLSRRIDLPIRSPFVLILVHVTPRQRDGVDIFDQLDLEYRKSVGPK
jgi:hypothetical protein